MTQVIRYAYLAELFLWVPLAWFVVTAPATRRWVAAPLAASVLAGLYEAYMTFVWERTVVGPIRVDIFLVLFVTCAANTLSGIALVIKRLFAAAAVCFVVPLLSLAGLAFMQSHVARLDSTLDRGRRYRFEAAFRDDAAQKRFFGDNVGYYVADDADDRVKHIVTNDAGRSWVYTKALYSSDKVRVVLRPQSGDTFLADVDFGMDPAVAPPKTFTVRKTAPPRFPPPSSPGDEVKFLGVFSGTYAERGRTFFVTQLWLWESKGEVWGRYIHGAYVRGGRQDFIHPETVRIKCTVDCRKLTLETERGPALFYREPDGSFKTQWGTQKIDVTLRQGETIPGLPLDLAPLGTARQNQEWLEAVLEAHMVSWVIPAK